MPLLSHFNPQPGVDIAVWQITESVAELESAFPAMQADMFAKDTRNLHWLSSRMALHAILGNDLVKLDKHENGKPLLTNDHRYVSLTHAGGYAAAAVSLFPVGIDLEQVLPRLARVQHKFVGVTERPYFSEDDLYKLCLTWSAKESVFKIYGDHAVDFRRQQCIRWETFDGNKLLLDLPEVPDRENIWVYIQAVCPDMWLTYAIDSLI